MRKNFKYAIATAALCSTMAGAFILTGNTTVSACTIEDEVVALSIEDDSTLTTIEDDAVPLSIHYNSDTIYLDDDAIALGINTPISSQNLQTSVSVLNSSSSGGDVWYHDTGTSIPSSATPSYNKYNLLGNVQPGDIVYESKAGYGITGHIAIVEGTYYCSEKNMYYIRVIEANTSGVKRGILDDTRVDEKGVTIYRVPNATNAQITAAINFCIGELDSTYSLDFQKDTSASETDWYCSELVWASYKNQGIDIETTGTLNEPGITPRDIARSSKVIQVSI